MLAVAKPLRTLCAGDLMSRNVVMVPQEMSVEGAARMLSQAQISGAPVVDGEGRCIGVISATDFVHWAENGRRPKDGDPACVCQPWQILEDHGFPDGVVRSLMTADPVTAAPVTPIATLARMMLDAHIHRVIVVDRNRRPVGVVSSTDILAAMAQSAQAD